jgi:hypothetical protein
VAAGAVVQPPAGSGRRLRSIRRIIGRFAHAPSEFRRQAAKPLKNGDLRRSCRMD